MMLRVGIEQPSDHALILRIVLLRFALEEFDAALAQCNGHLHALFPEYQILRGREKIRNDPESPEGFVRVLDFLAHRFASPSASNLLHGSDCVVTVG